MNWQQKLHTMQLLESNLIKMISPGKWICSIPGQIKKGHLRTSEFGQGKTPSEAVNKAWEILTTLPDDNYIILWGDKGSVRWAGTTFVNV